MSCGSRGSISVYKTKVPCYSGCGEAWSLPLSAVAKKRGNEVMMTQETGYISLLQKVSALTQAIALTQGFLYSSSRCLCHCFFSSPLWPLLLTPSRSNVYQRPVKGLTGLCEASDGCPSTHPPLCTVFVSDWNNWLAVEAEEPEPVPDEKKNGSVSMSKLMEAQSAPSGQEVPIGMRPFLHGNSLAFKLHW